MTASAATYCTCPELKAANASFGLEVEVSDVSPNSFMTAQALVEETISRGLVDAEHDVDRPVLERTFGITARIDDGKLQAEAVRNGSGHVNVNANDLVARHAGERGAARVHADAQNASFLNGRRLNLRGLRLGLVSGIGRAARHCERKNHGATDRHAKDSFPKTLRHRNLRLFLFMRFFRLT